MLNILLLGSTGMLGSMVKSYLKNRFNILEPRKFNVLTDEIPIIKCDYVINCIGLIKQRKSNDDLFYKINSEFPINLCNKYNNVIHISSDCVFSGNLQQDKSYKKTDAPDSTDVYGLSKLYSEKCNAMIIRTSIIGPSKDTNGLFEWFRSSNEVNGYDNHLWSGVTTLELAKQIEYILDQNKYNHELIQIGSTKISKYDLLISINEIFKLGKKINKISSNEVNRSFESDIICKPIKQQLMELKEYENKNIFNSS